MEAVPQTQQYMLLKTCFRVDYISAVVSECQGAHLHRFGSPSIMSSHSAW